MAGLSLLNASDVYSPTHPSLSTVSFSHVPGDALHSAYFRFAFVAS